MSRKTITAIAGWLLLGEAAAWTQTLPLPPRRAGAPTGSQFVRIISRMPLTERENWICAQVLDGNVPEFLRRLVPISVSAGINGTNHTGLYYVTPDYLAVGMDADYFLEPMTPILAQRLCDRLGCSLPTRKMVNQIWTNAAVKLNPQPIPPSAEMITVPVFAQHNHLVRTQRDSWTNSFPLGALVSGDKKDLVISTLIYSNLHTGVPRPVVIYGWHYPSGSPIQPLYNGHEATYADYSHGARLAQMAMTVDGNPTTVTNVLMDPNLAALLSDESASENTSAGVIRLPRYTIAGQGPVLLSQPRSQSLWPGARATLSAVVLGDLPLSYGWQRNGVALPAATDSALVITNAQSSNAGSYALSVTNAAGVTASRAAVVRVLTNGHPVVFADDFQADSSTQWSLFWGAANGVPDYSAEWGFDHSFVPYTFNGVTGLIPPAPNSPEGSTRAVRLTVNNTDTNGYVAGVSLYPRGQSFAGNFALKFDLWINYPGDVGGLNSTGSTQHATFGLDHLGTQVNWAAPSAASSDGIWFAADGEGGTSRDYRAYIGNELGAPVELIGPAASGLSESNNAAAFYQNLFPASQFETAGAPGKNWVEVELRQTGNVISWSLDGTVVAQRINTSSFTAGTIMLGLMDTFSSVANPAQDAFVLFDNVRVEDLSDRVRFLSAPILTHGQLWMSFSAVPGRDYLVEASTNLVSWQPLSTMHASNGPLPFLDPDVQSHDRRFYRVREVTP